MDRFFTNPAFVLALLIAVSFIAIALKQRRYYDDETFTKYRQGKAESFYEHKHLLTKAEYYFWRRLKSRCDECGFLICPKVRMEDFVNVKTDDYKLRQRYRGYIKSRHVDFLLCDKDLNIVAGIELDDSSHSKDNAKKIDGLKNDVFDAIGIPLYRIGIGGKKQDAQLDAIFVELVGRDVGGEDGDMKIQPPHSRDFSREQGGFPL